MALVVLSVCRSFAVRREWAREDLSDQGLPIIGATVSASEALPCEGSALSSTKLTEAGRDSFIGRSGCPLCTVVSMDRRNTLS
jgi:hypothetical protein